METRTIAERLALAESRVLRGDVELSRQRALVRHLERHGLGTLHARKLLRELEETLANLVAERDRLEADMAVPATNSVTSTSSEIKAVSVNQPLRQDFR